MVQCDSIHVPFNIHQMCSWIPFHKISRGRCDNGPSLICFWIFPLFKLTIFHVITSYACADDQTTANLLNATEWVESFGRKSISHDNDRQTAAECHRNNVCIGQNILATMEIVTICTSLFGFLRQAISPYLTE